MPAVTHSIAATLICCKAAPGNAPNSNCIGPNCMGWRWERHPKLEVVRGFYWRDFVDQYLAENPDSTQPARQEDFQHIEPPDFPVLPGWRKFNDPVFCTDDWCWVQRYQRGYDAEATGYCGLAGSLV